MPMFRIPKLMSVLIFLVALSLNASAAVPIATVTGIVTDEKGTPLERVKVQVCGMEKLQGNTWVRELRLGIMPGYYTDQQGRFKLPVNEADIRFDLYFDKLGFAPTFLYSISAKSDELKVVLKKGVPLTGVVTRLVEGKPVPVAGATVELQLPSEDLWYQQRINTDAQGRYTFRITPPPKKWKWRVAFLGEVIQVEVKDNEPVIGPDFTVAVQVQEKNKSDRPDTPADADKPDH